MKSAIFCHNGLGDAVNSLILSYNLTENGHEADVYHNGVELMKEWYPHLISFHYPSLAQIPGILSSYDKLIIFHNDTSDFVQRLIKEGKELCPAKVCVIYAYPSKKVHKSPYYKDSRFIPTLPISENLYRFCRDILKLKEVTKSNGITPPFELNHRKHQNRVALHITSTREGKNWPIEKYVKLALQLEKRGYSCSFLCGGKKDREGWEWLEDIGCHLPLFHDLNELAPFIYESGYLIGNDSGLGHLASSMGIPTVTIGRKQGVSKFWRPNFCANQIVCPNNWIPNISKFRLRDRHWKKFVSVNKVLKSFDRLVRQDQV